ncbi:MAG: transcription-repair coupling factor [Chthonomonadales bacterium]
MSAVIAPQIDVPLDSKPARLWSTASLVDSVSKHPSASDLLANINRTEITSIQLDGLAGSARSIILAWLFRNRPGIYLVVTAIHEEALAWVDDLIQFGLLSDEVVVLPATSGMRMGGDLGDIRAVGERISALEVLQSGRPAVVVTTGMAAFQPTVSPDMAFTGEITLEPGRNIDILYLTERLVEIGYASMETVAGPGQFSRRGGIVDIFPITAETPARLDFFGDEIESIRAIDVVTQRSNEKLKALRVLPAAEIRFEDSIREAGCTLITEALHDRKMEFAREKNREAFDHVESRIGRDVDRIRAGIYFDGLIEYLPYLMDKSFDAFDFLADGARRANLGGVVIFDEPGQILIHDERIAEEQQDSQSRRYDHGDRLDQPTTHSRTTEGVRLAHERFTSIDLSQMSRKHDFGTIDLHLAGSGSVMDSFRGRLPYYAEQAKNWVEKGADAIIVTDQPHRVAEICRDLGLAVLSNAEPNQSGSVRILEGRLRRGFKFVEAGLFVATDAELFGGARPIQNRRRAATGVPISTVLDLRDGDFVVHIHHGIGQYMGLVKRKIENTERDFLHVQYLGGDNLFVPADQIDRLQRYVGDGNKPVVHRIGGGEWARVTRRVKEQAKDMANELIELYAARNAAERPSYGPDTPWQMEMEEAFPYEETNGQLNAIADVKSDLEKERPMDRLVCADVGFGKTEVAMRAAFKAVDAGKQVAVLCPTTILAAQHFRSFSERFAAYPTRVDLLSRFRSPSEIRATIEALKIGAADVVIGTHRLLSKDIEFKNLGLVVVDEEQRFGVAHKERLKQLRKSVDVLTLTATPIPRTLSMAMSGLRDMSVIEDPPRGRLPIVTYVREYDDDLIKDAVLRELERNGQVYFIHNRIESIAHVAQRISRLVPAARVGIGHGQMSDDDLEQLMYDFYHQEVDVLVCTTIVENGLDVPNVNTIIVDRSDRMGLAQLYQLRGRVGRSDRQAYCYLLFRPHKQLTEQAELRLTALQEFTSLGSGFQIAMRDLEIRGAGNLLGSEQSGAIVSVGYDLYCQLLAQAVTEAKGEEISEDILPPVDLPITAHIPEDYIPNEAERIFFYKRMSSVRAVKEIEALQEELEDRYGDPPKPVWTALAVLRLRLRAKNAGIASVRGERTEVLIKFGPNARLTPEAIRMLQLLYKKHRFTGDSVTFSLTSPRMLEEVENVVDVLEKAVVDSHAGRR